MQRAMYPSPYMRITAGFEADSHKGTFALDDAGSDSGIDIILAPFDCMIKKIYEADANEVWIESLYPVKFADGTEDYMTMMFVHDNDVSDLWIGKTFKQGEKFYDEGSKGRGQVGTFGNHVHFECGRGKFEGSGWHANEYGIWMINNAKRPDECLWIDDSYHILEKWGFDWKKVPSKNSEQESELENLKKENELLKNENESLKNENARLKTENSNRGKIVYVCKKNGKYKIKLTLNENEKIVIEKGAQL